MEQREQARRAFQKAMNRDDSPLTALLMHELTDEEQELRRFIRVTAESLEMGGEEEREMTMQQTDQSQSDAPSQGTREKHWTDELRETIRQIAREEVKRALDSLAHDLGAATRPGAWPQYEHKGER